MNVDSLQQAPFPERGRLIEFQVSQPVLTPTTLATVPAFTTLATVTVHVNNPQNAVWLNATVNWYADFTAAGAVDVVFQILRGTTVVYEVQQSIWSPTTVTPPLRGHSVVYLQHVETNLTTAPGTVPFTYTLRAGQVTSAAATAATAGPVSLTAAQLRPNTVPSLP
ncbi:MAG: hypothetical protein PWP43_728 [Bacillota bacterium]|jgi:hypothetical protein|nr:hypothetical protein [Bacillota bacterium]